MDPETAQQTWDEYYERIRQRRMSEARVIQSQMRGAGVTDTTPLVFDFAHFSSGRSAAEALAAQLSENYEMTLRPDEKTDYWFADGTTRPDAFELTEQEYFDWVQFMCDVAHSYGCVFTSFRVEDPQSGHSWSNQDILTDES